MQERKISRRDALAATAAVGSLGVLAGGAEDAAAAVATPRLDFEDPRSRARILAKIKGSIAEETVYTFCRLHLIFGSTTATSSRCCRCRI